MQGELQLVEDVGGGAFPGHFITDQLAVFAVVVEAFHFHAAAVVVFARVIEAHPEHGEVVAVEGIADGLLPLAVIRFGARFIEQGRPAYLGFHRFMQGGGGAGLERPGGGLGDHGHDRVEDFPVQVQGERGERQNQ